MDIKEAISMITDDLKRKINLLPRESYAKVERLVERLFLLDVQNKREGAFKTLMEKMNEAEILFTAS